MLLRLLTGGFALFLALPAGVLVFASGALLDPALRDAFGRLGHIGLAAAFTDLAAGLPPDGATAMLAILAQMLALLLALPPFLSAAIGEVFGLRSPGWYGGACAALTAALPWLARGAVVPPAGPAAIAEARLTALLLATGAASGLVYWLLAGRTAGTHARPHGS